MIRTSLGVACVSLVLFSSLCLCACGSNEGQGQDPATGAQTAEVTTVDSAATSSGETEPVRTDETSTDVPMEAPSDVSQTADACMGDVQLRD